MDMTTTSPRCVRMVGLLIALGGAAWVLRFTLAVGGDNAGANAGLQVVCNLLTLAGFGLPLGIALALTAHIAHRTNRAAQVAAFALFVATALGLVGLTNVSVTAFGRAMWTDAPSVLTDELPALVMGMTGLLVAPLLWQNASETRRAA